MRSKVQEAMSSSFERERVYASGNVAAMNRIKLTLIG